MRDRETQRLRLVAAVHAAAKAAGLDETTRRDLMERETGLRSAREMTPYQLGRVLDAINHATRRPDAHRPHLAKVRALWWSLYWLAALKGIEDQADVLPALDAFVKRQTGIERAAWLTAAQSASVIEALKSWLAREGVGWTTVSHGDGPLLPGDGIESRCVAEALWARLCAAGVMKQPGALAAWARAFWGDVQPGCEPHNNQPWNPVVIELGRRWRDHVRAAR